MANRHHGKLADVWKHLALCALLEHERPARYAETHAGSAAYPASHDAERTYGVTTFLRLAGDDPTLAASAYRRHVQRLAGGDLATDRMPGSPLLAVLTLGPATRYLLCDLDPASTADIDRWATRLGVADQVTTVTGDGMAAVVALLRAAPDDTFVHVDPYDPHASAPGGLSALALAAQVITAGVGLMYWYGYDAPADRTWALDHLQAATGAALWCGDVLVTTHDGGTADDGDLGRATTPGTGCGVVVANVAPTALARCAELGAALAGAYRGQPLPDGPRGALDFRVTQPVAR